MLTKSNKQQNWNDGYASKYFSQKLYDNIFPKYLTVYKSYRYGVYHLYRWVLLEYLKILLLYSSVHNEFEYEDIFSCYLVIFNQTLSSHFEAPWNNNRQIGKLWELGLLSSLVSSLFYTICFERRIEKLLQVMFTKTSWKVLMLFGIIISTISDRRFEFESGTHL